MDPNPSAHLDAFLEEVDPELRVDVAELLPDVYSELVRRAGATLRRFPVGQSLTPTELCHETYLRLSRNGSIDWASDQHFVAAATIAMRRIAIDRIRARVRRHDHVRPAETSEELLPLVESADDRLVLLMDGLLRKLQQHDERVARIVVLRFYLGMSETEVGAALEVNERTVRRDWVYAKAWLTRELEREGFVGAGDHLESLGRDGVD